MPKCREHKPSPILISAVDSEWDECVVLPETDIRAAKNKDKSNLASAQTSNLRHPPLASQTHPAHQAEPEYLPMVPSPGLEV